MRAFVTGAGGFAGKWLCKHLEACDDEVIPPPDGFDVTVPQVVRAAIIEAQPEVLFHLAAQSLVAESWARPAKTFDVNATGTLHVLDAALACEVPPTVVLVSSADVYGHIVEGDLPVSEDQPLAPFTPFAASKVAAEYLGVQAHLGTRLPVVRARSFNHVGPGQTTGFVVSALAHRIVTAERNGDRTIRVGNLQARRDYTDVRDVVRAYRLLAERGRPGEVYNVCSAKELRVQDVAERLLAISGSALELEEDPGLFRPLDFPVLQGDNHRLREATGWRPEIGLDQMLADVLRYWRDRRP